jgi:sulfatase maturation enzyme AslB (radical SAM superfamily)
MRPDTATKLIEFVESFRAAKTLSVTWYGGEPTINKAFEIVERRFALTILILIFQSAPR